MDLSWHKGGSLNDGVQHNVYLDTSFKLSYPCIKNITDALIKLVPVGRLDI